MTMKMLYLQVRIQGQVMVVMQLLRFLLALILALVRCVSVQYDFARDVLLGKPNDSSVHQPLVDDCNE